jgi:hypothetical protein
MSFNAELAALASTFNTKLLPFQLTASQVEEGGFNVWEVQDNGKTIYSFRVNVSMPATKIMLHSFEK